MNSTKLVATPEAYKLLTSLPDGDSTKSAVSAAFWLLSTKLKSPDYFIEGCPIALVAYWAKNPSEDSIVLMDKHKGHPLNDFLDNYRTFFKKLETAIPVSLS